MSRYLFMIEVETTRVGEVLDFVKGSGLDFDFEKMDDGSDSYSPDAPTVGVAAPHQAPEPDPVPEVSLQPDPPQPKWLTIPYKRGYRSSNYTLYLPMAEPNPSNSAVPHVDIWRVLKSICDETGEPASRQEWRERCLSLGMTDQQFRDSAYAMMKAQGRGVRKVRLNPNYKEG